jgi:hypothetical protein
MEEREITVTLTGLEFGALAGAVATEASRLIDSKGKAPSDYVLGVLNSAWLKMLKEWHPGLDVETLNYTDEITLFGNRPFNPEKRWTNKTSDPVDSDSDGVVDDKSLAPVIDLFKKSG